ncbi:hypothetical protein OHD62_23805 [Mesorhizobium sp. YC-39]|uniref:hypothetical protein n=1 Tax=unclassified Mesorhizobium TaxID=325217 RepID=UPI0021E98725|nr:MULTISPECIES: hypothetical protein [unclassified Mesorhizobium]MCV3209240.1 hypothetical protein [Mesorhizobium sp. YC-2]MCV3231410.1 hypothetical protein [Mesorhizobium sp. YC-39]
MPRAISYKGEIITELSDGEDWVVVGDKIIIAKSIDPALSQEITVPEGDIEGLVEVWRGGA